MKSKSFAEASQGRPGVCVSPPSTPLWFLLKALPLRRGDAQPLARERVPPAATHHETFGKEQGLLGQRGRARRHHLGIKISR